jgi:hypothetical protein
MGFSNFCFEDKNNPQLNLQFLSVWAGIKIEIFSLAFNLII